MTDDEHTTDEQGIGDETIDVSVGGDTSDQPATDSEPARSGQPTSLDETPTLEGDDDPDLVGPEKLHTTPPSELTLDDLDHPDIDEQARMSMIQQYDHLREEYEQRQREQEATGETEAVTHHDLETEPGQIDVDAVVEQITGSARTRPTVTEVKVAYADDEITDAEMDAVMGVAVREEGDDSGATASPPSDPSGEPTAAGAGDDRDDDPDPDSDSEDVEPDPTLDDTGLLDEDGEFSWEGTEITESSQVGERVEHKFEFKNTPFEVTEPARMDDLERPIRQLQDFQEIDDHRKQQKMKQFRRELADECLTVQGTPHYDVYIVEHPEKGKTVVPDPTGEHGLEDHSKATSLWGTMNWYDKFKIGQRMSEEILGERKFRDRYD
ncbi:hypothetical protein [Saliphagus sp. LR7]|uniref:hypothetical protein n=1 Tax=Saliphagus sp. LR7 TaxID=2282654 RepID=UPI0013005B3B|nr:hypothetical protein [Saliphagus sp. LR7]